MKRVFSGIRCLTIILALSFKTVFAAAQTARQHAEQIVAQGAVYTSITAITSIQPRQERLFDHTVDQHFGLDPNSYATYNPVGSENKELRSEFILADAAIIDQTAPVAVTVPARRVEVEGIALHNYLVETLTYKRLPIERQEGLAEMLTILSAEYTQAILNAKDPQNKTQLLQNTINALRDSAVWDNLKAVYNQVAHGPFFENIIELDALIKKTATGGATPLSGSTSTEKVTVITNIKERIENLIGSFKKILEGINRGQYSMLLLEGGAPAYVKHKMQRMIDSLNKPSVWDKLQTICTRLDTINHATYSSLFGNITALRERISEYTTDGTKELSRGANSAAKIKAIEEVKGQIGNLIGLQRLNVATSFPAARQIAEEAFIYAVGLAGKHSNVVGESIIDIYCPLLNPVPNPITANIVRMVSQTPWYRPNAVVGNVGAMTTQAQRPEAGRIMVGFSRYSVVGAHLDGSNYQVGNLDYTTMYPI